METLIWFNDVMLKLPLGAVAMVFGIMFGYLLKCWNRFDNHYIPVVQMPVTACVFMILNLCADLMAALAPGVVPHPWLRMPLFFVYGFCFGGFAWLLHARVLKAWLDPKWFNDDGSRKS